MKKNKLEQIVESIVGNINEKLQDGGAEMYDDGTGVFGGQKMSLGMRDELDYDKNEMEKALSKQFHTPENYQPRIQPEIGKMYKSHDDTVKVTNIDEKGYIHLIMSPNPTFAEKYGIPEFNKPIPLTWSQKQFDTLITESKKINVNSIVENITKTIISQISEDKPYSKYGNKPFSQNRSIYYTEKAKKRIQMYWDSYLSNLENGDEEYVLNQMKQDRSTISQLYDQVINILQKQVDINQKNIEKNPTQDELYGGINNRQWDI